MASIIFLASTHPYTYTIRLKGLWDIIYDKLKIYNHAINLFTMKHVRLDTNMN